MTKQTIIYLVRHGESVFNKQAIITGQADPALTDVGRKQARLAQLKLKDVKFDAAYSSDLQRAVETGEIIYGKPIPKTNQIRGLRERHYGLLEGKPLQHMEPGNEVMKTLPHEESWVYKHVPDMESDHEVSSRFLTALEVVAKKNYGKTILVAAHGSTIRTTLMKLKGLTVHDLPPGSFQNTGYIELVYDGNKFKVVQVSGVKP